MNIINFSEKTFREIPKQDNPAFMTKKEWDELGENGCIMIVKQYKQTPPYMNCGRICVLDIAVVEFPEEEENVTQLGLFWELSHALLFANALVKERRQG